MRDRMNSQMGLVDVITEGNVARVYEDDTWDGEIRVTTVNLKSGDTVGRDSLLYQDVPDEPKKIIKDLDFHYPWPEVTD